MEIEFYGAASGVTGSCHILRIAGRQVLLVYTRRDAVEAWERLVPLPYREYRELLPDLVLRPHDAGHILGSALVELELREEGISRRLVYSGDIGQYDTPSCTTRRPSRRRTWC